VAKAKVNEIHSSIKTSLLNENDLFHEKYENDKEYY